MLRALARCAILVAAVAVSAALHAQDGPARGRLLVASSDLSDPNFAQSVVLLLHYEDDGALGLIINRPTWVRPVSVFPELGFLDDYAGHVFVGGPLARTSIAALARGNAAAALSAEAVVDGVYMSGDLEALRGIAADARGEESLRIYAGHALWRAGQLDQEIEAGAWRVLPARNDLVFTAEPGRLWEELAGATSGFLVGVGDHRRVSSRTSSAHALRLLR
jgi:putative transcriptional regulator